jgi:hypothetical protein
MQSIRQSKCRDHLIKTWPGFVQHDAESKSNLNKLQQRVAAMTTYSLENLRAQQQERDLAYIEYTRQKRFLDYLKNLDFELENTIKLLENDQQCKSFNRSKTSAQAANFISNNNNLLENYSRKCNRTDLSAITILPDRFIALFEKHCKQKQASCCSCFSSHNFYSDKAYDPKIFKVKLAKNIRKRLRVQNRMCVSIQSRLRSLTIADVLEILKSKRTWSMFKNSTNLIKIEESNKNSKKFQGQFNPEGLIAFIRQFVEQEGNDI